MCYAVPAKIISIDGENAIVDYGGIKKEVNVSLLETPKPGEYCLVHAGFAIERLDKTPAEESLRLITRGPSKNG